MRGFEVAEAGRRLMRAQGTEKLTRQVEECRIEQVMEHGPRGKLAGVEAKN